MVSRIDGIVLNDLGFATHIHGEKQTSVDRMIMSGHESWSPLMECESDEEDDAEACYSKCFPANNIMGNMPSDHRTLKWSLRLGHVQEEISEWSTTVKALGEEGWEILNRGLDLSGCAAGVGTEEDGKRITRRPVQVLKDALGKYTKEYRLVKKNMDPQGKHLQKNLEKDPNIAKEWLNASKDAESGVVRGRCVMAVAQHGVALKATKNAWIEKISKTPKTDDLWRILARSGGRSTGAGSRKTAVVEFPIEFGGRGAIKSKVGQTF